MQNPFMDQSGHGAVDVESRLDLVKRFDVDQLRAALAVPHLQKSVVNRIHSRLNKLRKEAAHG
ncbi:hypothetical protein E4656_13650 [Natronospirillum operosum]|uniref:50S ribosomal protein L29 n=1 Tax=Natronospirillum operosum TaxID=2759953 RepID=A0A4Z0WEC8_9GAMM|nr:hypothetical protein [Natronospirillum operosum]TGG92511.1 hypothetical protein E4656_13650 [Natronospirillum operosum]